MSWWELEQGAEKARQFRESERIARLRGPQPLSGRITTEREFRSRDGVIECYAEIMSQTLIGVNRITGYPVRADGINWLDFTIDWDHPSQVVWKITGAPTSQGKPTYGLIANRVNFGNLDSLWGQAGGVIKDGQWVSGKPNIPLDVRSADQRNLEELLRRMKSVGPRYVVKP